MSDERVHDIHDLYHDLEVDSDNLAALLHALLKPNRSPHGYDSERQQLIAVASRIHDHLNGLVGRTLEYDRQLRKRAKKAKAA